MPLKPFRPRFESLESRDVPSAWTDPDLPPDPPPNGPPASAPPPDNGPPAPPPAGDTPPTTPQPGDPADNGDAGLPAPPPPSSGSSPPPADDDYGWDWFTFIGDEIGWADPSDSDGSTPTTGAEEWIDWQSSPEAEWLIWDTGPGSDATAPTDGSSDPANSTQPPAAPVGPILDAAGTAVTTVVVSLTQVQNSSTAQLQLQTQAQLQARLQLQMQAQMRAQMQARLEAELRARMQAQAQQAGVRLPVVSRPTSPAGGLQAPGPQTPGTLTVLNMGIAAALPQLNFVHYFPEEIKGFWVPESTAYQAYYNGELGQEGFSHAKFSELSAYRTQVVSLNGLNRMAYDLGIEERTINDFIAQFNAKRSMDERREWLNWYRGQLDAHAAANPPTRQNEMFNALQNYSRLLQGAGDAQLTDANRALHAQWYAEKQTYADRRAFLTDYEIVLRRHEVSLGPPPPVPPGPPTGPDSTGTSGTTPPTPAPGGGGGLPPVPPVVAAPGAPLPDPGANIPAIAQQIANGHAYDKHVVQQGEFPGIADRAQFATEVQRVMTTPTHTRRLGGGRTAY